MTTNNPIPTTCRASNPLVLPFPYNQLATKINWASREGRVLFGFPHSKSCAGFPKEFHVPDANRVLSDSCSRHIFSSILFGYIPEMLSRVPVSRRPLLSIVYLVLFSFDFVSFAQWFQLCEWMSIYIYIYKYIYMSLYDNDYILLFLLFAKMDVRLFVSWFGLGYISCTHYITHRHTHIHTFLTTEYQHIRVYHSRTRTQSKLKTSHHTYTSHNEYSSQDVHTLEMSTKLNNNKIGFSVFTETERTLVELRCTRMYTDIIT